MRIEENIAKKPINCIYKYLTGEKSYFYRCPNCDNIVYDDDKTCSECGQMLDWSENQKDKNQKD